MVLGTTGKKKQMVARVTKTDMALQDTKRVARDLVILYTRYSDQRTLSLVDTPRENVYSTSSNNKTRNSVGAGSARIDVARFTSRSLVPV